MSTLPFEKILQHMQSAAMVHLSVRTYVAGLFYVHAVAVSSSLLFVLSSLLFPQLYQPCSYHSCISWAAILPLSRHRHDNHHREAFSTRRRGGYATGQSRSWSMPTDPEF